MAVIEVTGASFEKEVVQSDRPVLADFYANWCGPCRMLRPTLEAIADERQDIKVVSINIDDEDELADLVTEIWHYAITEYVIKG